MALTRQSSNCANSTPSFGNDQTLLGDGYVRTVCASYLADTWCPSAPTFFREEAMGGTILQLDAGCSEGHVRFVREVESVSDRCRVARELKTIVLHAW